MLEHNQPTASQESAVELTLLPAARTGRSGDLKRSILCFIVWFVQAHHLANGTFDCRNPLLASQV